MSYFAAVLAKTGLRWHATEVDLADCEAADDICEVVQDIRGDVRLLVVEQDDEYAVLGRLDHGEDELRLFLSNAHAADSYPLAAVVADGLEEIGGSDDELDEDAEDVPPVHESVPCGDPGVVADLGTSADELLEMCSREGTLPIDVIATVCENAGCAEVFEAVHG